MVNSLGYGEVWSDPERRMVHFGSPVEVQETYVLVDKNGKPLPRKG